MAKYKNRRRGSGETVTRALNYTQRRAADNRIETFERRMIMALCPCPVKADEFVRECFKPELLAQLHAAALQTNEAISDNPDYPLIQTMFSEKVTFRYTKWAERRTFAPKLDMFNIATVQHKITPWVNKVTDLRIQWQHVRHVLNELDQRCTLNALLHYWPVVHSLVPELDTSASTMFREPDSIGELLPMIRASVALIGSAVMYDRAANMAGHDQQGVITFAGCTMHNLGYYTIRL